MSTLPVPSLASKRQPTRFNQLRHLPLGISVALHAIALMMPMLPPEQPSETSVQLVRIVQLPPRPRSSRLVFPKTQPPQPQPMVSDAQSSRKPKVIAPTVPVSPTPVNQPPVTYKPGNPPSKLAESAVPKSEQSPTALPSNPSTQPLPDSQTAQNGFQAFITAVKTGDTFTSYSLLEILELFGQPGQVELFFNQQAEQKPGILEFQVFPDKSSEQMIQEVVQMELGDRQGFTLQKQQSHDTTNVFVVTKHGFTRYVHVVPLNARSGSLLVIWDRPPAIAIR